MTLAGLVNKDSGRRRRRAMVTLMYLGVAGVPGTILWWDVSAPSVSQARTTLALLLVLAAAVSCLLLVTFAALRGATQEVANRDDEDLDERQRMVRNGAYRTAYNVFAALLLPFSLSVFAMAWGWYPSWLAPESVALAVCYTYLWLTITLPTAALARREPDPEAGGP